MSDDKYVTFKREEWEAFQSHVKYAMVAALPTPLDDTVVIRKQDIFAAAGLSAYAQAMVAAAESLDVLLADAPGWTIPTERQIQVVAALTRISDHFFEQAEEARGWPKHKVPD